MLNYRVTLWVSASDTKSRDIAQAIFDALRLAGIAVRNDINVTLAKN
ncbi:MAG: hypothetical protein ACREJC_09880 [Tepidisphaeraceae bacterium]